MFDVNHGDRDVEETSARLADGLKSCRTIVKNYRALLSSDPSGEVPEEESASSIEDPPASLTAPDQALG